MDSLDNVTLENHVKLFVETKVGERVSIEFSTGCVFVKPHSKQGSTTLGAFWARVIQGYFPSPQFTYKKTYCSSRASEALTTVADDYAITIYLRSGLLTVEGRLAYEWFKIIFRKVLQHYDTTTFSTTINYFKDQIVLDTRKEIHKKDRQLFQDIARPEIVDEKLALVSSDVDLDLPTLNDRFGSQCIRTTTQSSQRSLVPFEGPSTLASNSSVMLKDGESYVYPMWKQLLNKWLSTDQCKVYICSKHIDTERLKVLSSMAYKYRLNSGLETAFTDAVTSTGRRMSEVKELLLRGLTTDEQLFTEYRIINKIKYAATKSIACNFIAGLYEDDGVVELMVTSASFDAEGFEKLNNLHTVVVTKVSNEEFHSNFIQKLCTL